VKLPSLETCGGCVSTLATECCRLVLPVSSTQNRRGPSVKKSDLLRALQQEIRRHDFSCFVDEPPSIAQGGKGVVVPGCPACLKRINTMSQFLDHLADDVLPSLIEKLSTESKGEVIEKS
jgi:hypothetical protein